MSGGLLVSWLWIEFLIRCLLKLPLSWPICCGHELQKHLWIYDGTLFDCSPFLFALSQLFKPSSKGKKKQFWRGFGYKIDPLFLGLLGFKVLRPGRMWRSPSGGASFKFMFSRSVWRDHAPERFFKRSSLQNVNKSENIHPQGFLEQE